MVKLSLPICIWIIFSTSTIDVCAEAFRVFTDTKNRTITARPINIVGNKIRIEREDGVELNINRDIFTENDQRYLMYWAIKKLSADNRLTIHTKRPYGKVAKKAEEIVLTSGRVVEDGFRIKQYDGYYQVTIENGSGLTLNNLRAAYILFSDL